MIVKESIFTPKSLDEIEQYFYDNIKDKYFINHSKSAISGSNTRAIYKGNDIYYDPEMDEIFIELNILGENEEVSQWKIKQFTNNFTGWDLNVYIRNLESLQKSIDNRIQLIKNELNL